MAPREFSQQECRDEGLRRPQEFGGGGGLGGSEREGSTLTSNGTAVSIVVPTLREAANLRPMAGRVAGALADSGIARGLLLVDDDPRDGSEAVAAEPGKRLPVRMPVRRGVRADLSHVVLDGIALGRYDRIVVMDADLSHPPERIPKT